MLCCKPQARCLEATNEEQNYSMFVIATTYLAFVEFHFRAIFKSCFVYDDSNHFPSCAVKDGKNVAFGKALSTDVLKLIEAIIN